MADATPNGETGTPPAPKTEPTPPAAPAPQEPVKTEDSAVEQLRKELEQTKMRANQLENEKKSREEAEAKAKADELEEQNQFKSLYEQEKAKREAVEAEREQAEKSAELTKAKTDVLAEYSEEVRALAQDVGVDLTDTDEAAVTSFKEKLDKINTRVATTAQVGPNNRRETSKEEELTPDQMREMFHDDPNGAKFHEYVTKKYPGIAAMTTPKQ